MWPFTPRYIKHAKLLHKGVSRFINYKRDILPATKLKEVEDLRDELKAAIKAGDRAKIDALHDTINDTCSRALPDYRTSEIAENVEVFFVAIVVALGIRAYIAQPFQIPTGSMQPTLNGFRAEATKEDPTPNIIAKATGWLTGRKYINLISDHDGYLAADEPIQEHSVVLINYSTINFEDGHKIYIWAPKRQLLEDLGMQHNIQVPMKIAVGPDGKELRTPDDKAVHDYAGGRVWVSKGQLLARGILTSGDHVLVNKFAYHFRPPTRGEVFVFTTKHIKGIEMSGSYDARQGSQHYIKRLVGVPGDHVQVEPPELWINGKPAEEFGPKRVASKAHTDFGDYGGYVKISYPGAMNEVTLAPHEYMACGDNSANSLDSRYWGPVPEENIVGPALFAYFPFGSHWGPIR